MNRLIKYGAFGVIFLFIALNISCVKRVFIPVEKEIIRTEILRDTIVSYLLDKENIFNVSDTVSIIETKYSVSKAYFDGKLYHSIWNKDTILDIKVITKEIQVEKKVPAPYPVEVEKKVPVPTRMPMRTWESVLFWLGAISLLAIIIRVSIFFIKR